MEVLSDLVSKGASTAWVVTVNGGPWCWSAMTTYWKELCCAMLGVLVWTVLTPLLSVVMHFATAVGLFVYKWASLLKLCLRRFRRFVKKRATLSTSRCDYCWALFEAMWATPMMVLEARREHEQGLGRLLHRWIVAYHELWCVFLPNSVEYGWRATKKYGGGVQIEWGRTMGRARCVFQGLWTLVTLVTFGCFYGVVGVYELFEWVCLGWKGVTALLAMINYYYASTGNVNVAGLFSMKSEVALASGAVLLVGCTSRVWRWYEDSAEGRTPARMAKDGYAAWIQKLEELVQAKRLSEAFWRLDGCDSSVKPKPLKTISEKRAEYEALKAKWRAEEAEAARRGRRALFGEDVPSGSGGRRLGTAHDAECWSVTEQLANQLAGDFGDASD